MNSRNMERPSSKPDTKGITIGDATYREFLDVIKEREAERSKNTPVEPVDHVIEIGIKGRPDVTDDVLLEEELRLKRIYPQSRKS